MRLTKYLAAAAAVCVAGGLAWGAGIFQTYPLIGQGSYCASTIGAGPIQAGPTGFGAGVASPGATGLPLCGQTVPAGPTVFAGTEVAPFDLYTPGTAQIAGGPATGLVNILQLGQGPLVVNTTAGNVTIPNTTSWYIENVGNTSATITLPSAPIHGQVVHISLATAQTTSVLFGASAGQSCIPACPFTSAVVAAGTGDAFVYNAPNTTWYKIY